MADNQKIQKEIAEAAAKLYKRVLKRYYTRDKNDKRPFSVMLDEELKRFNDDVKPIIEDAVYSHLQKGFTTEDLPDVVPSKSKLSSMLHRNAKRVASYVAQLFKSHSKAKEAMMNIARKLYDGYGFHSTEMIDAKKELPLYLKQYLAKQSNQRALQRQISKLKTKPLRIAYKQLAKAAEKMNNEAMHRAAKVALEEKSRYYANRIAVTESQRAKNLARAKEYLEDDEIEFVKYRMSSKHPMMDICDYYANLDVGYGKGIVPKEQMVSLPLHPHCMCRYDPYYREVKKRTPNRWIESQPIHTQRQVLGGYAQWKKWKEGTPIERVFNMSRPKYPIKRYSEVLEYNSGMKKFNAKNLTDIEIKTIKKWTEDSTNIKMTMWGLSKTHIHEANILFNLFDKYTPNIKNGIKLYRGMSFTEADFRFYNFHKISVGDLHTPDEKAIVSFSTSKRLAFEYATYSNAKNYKVLYILENEKDAFDISSLSSKPFEEENIITKNIWYNVVHVRVFKRGGEIWKIIKIKPEEK